ncbi:HD domain-containing protein [Vibrio genomosp. F10]|uniref:HD/PDEase domain-containing protein n=1 Tax=Vibrio genomosp. F10 TaxID=723171 RepID=A0A1B9R3D5_9VIBR|nr:TraI domain-containing protein [Vibrio genomosp. F10]OCH78731.1 hypothetical protein A6E14_16745 [Vibrio genomosp. F10]
MVIEFIELNELVTIDELKCFSEFWKKDPTLLPIFITAPASHKHHHSYPHGLLKHSVETARLSWNQANQLNLSEIECQLALMAGLIHDVGKVFPILKSGGAYCPSEHECQNWAILGVPLGQLAETKYPWYEILCDALTPRANKKIVNRVKKIVRFSDQLSAINDITEQRFSTSPSHHHFTRHHKKKYRRAV